MRVCAMGFTADPAWPEACPQAASWRARLERGHVGGWAETDAVAVNGRCPGERVDT
jgi:hypothetical protein